MKAKLNGDLNRFTREEAKRTLDEVCRRYGIHKSNAHGQPLADKSSSAPKEPAKQHPQPTVKSKPSVSTARGTPVEKMRPEQHFERTGVCHPIVPESGYTSDNKSFHYLIRIAECGLTLHCEVIAESEEAATYRVKQIPNLMEWRVFSLE